MAYNATVGCDRDTNVMVRCVFVNIRSRIIAAVTVGAVLSEDTESRGTFSFPRWNTGGLGLGTVPPSTGTGKLPLPCVDERRVEVRWWNDTNSAIADDEGKGPRPVRRSGSSLVIRTPILASLLKGIQIEGNGTQGAFPVIDPAWAC